MTRLDQLPVIIGAGQDMRPVPTDLTDAATPSDLAGQALRRAFADAGIAPRAIDICYAVRLFADSGPIFPNPFGGSSNFPASVCEAAGSSARRHIYDYVGGETPQVFVANAARHFMAGEAEIVAVVGAEAAANVRAAQRAGVTLNWAETRNEPLEDRGPTPPGNQDSFGFGGFMITPQAISHRIVTPTLYYALMESARRAALGDSKAAYAERMSAIWQEFSAVAAKNPYAFVNQKVTGADIVRPGPDNPMIASPYTRAMIARDGVNLGAAILITTYGTAKRLGVSDVTFLYGHDQSSEPPPLMRARLDRAEAQTRVLQSVGRDADMYDLYSCFPIVPLEASRILGLNGETRPRTLTGGLPFFGGPGNNYSLHAIAEAHSRVRGTDKTAVIYANGGMATKHAAGRYGGQPPDAVQLDESPQSDAAVPVHSDADPSGRIAAYTVEYRRGEPTGVLIIGETAKGSRFYARAGAEHAETFTIDDPLGAAFQTQTKGGQNLLTRV
ncbi:hypothetical protein ACFFUB_01085 [Algimonas porphyrae]|uniref:Acetyl-CoA acetyltransferase n=1 Tax=Algimonas porphyrae TaxID=1128113 RepID=A0ABQ5UZA8_9PROT|nr:hypothetical protein [Algimonas porphyrae]GLQ20629.1 acetyl-CoA acetyltransferase [Algimonas porphyrae]